MKRLVCWGGTEGEDSLRHIMRAYHTTARKIGVDTAWVPDHERSLPVLTPGTTVLTADVWSKAISEARPGVSYVCHNYDGSHELCQSAAPENLIRLQVWTTAASGEEWAPFRQFDHEARTLFMPWGADLMAEEFMEPVFNPHSQDVTFVGAIWGDRSEEHGELGNIDAINDVRMWCSGAGLKFRHLTQVTDAENIAAVREARLAPAVAGAWQCEHGYLPCRAFKAAAYGVLCVTNVPQMNSLMGAARIGGDSVRELLGEALGLGRGRYLALVREQQRVVADYTYRESIAAIDRAFKEIRA